MSKKKRHLTLAEFDELRPLLAKTMDDEALDAIRSVLVIEPRGVVYEYFVQQAIKAHPEPPPELTMFLLKHGRK